MPNFCSHCGKPARPSARFCIQCGGALADPHDVTGAAPPGAGEDRRVGPARARRRWPWVVGTAAMLALAAAVAFLWKSGMLFPGTEEVPAIASRIEPSAAPVAPPQSTGVGGGPMSAVPVLEAQPSTNLATAPSAAEICGQIFRICSSRRDVTCANVRVVGQLWGEAGGSASTCQGACAEAVRDRLAGEGINAGHGVIDSGAPGPSGCVGFRPDLGGSEEGARCLAGLLGPSYQVGRCTSDGFPYNVYTH